MEQLGVHATLEEVSRILAGHFGRVFDCEIANGGTGIPACVAGDTGIPAGVGVGNGELT
jgi:hypothetical protein